jgi:hypothetical protein
VTHPLRIERFSLDPGVSQVFNALSAISFQSVLRGIILLEGFAELPFAGACKILLSGGLEHITAAQIA